MTPETQAILINNTTLQLELYSHPMPLSKPGPLLTILNDPPCLLWVPFMTCFFPPGFSIISLL